MTDSPYIIDITPENFGSVVVEGSMQVPVLVDFWADWCQPCKALIPVLEKLVNEYQGKFILAKVNTEEQQEIAAHFQIRSIPAVKLFKDGQPVDEFMGALPEAEIRTFLDKYIENESGGQLEQVQQMILEGRTDEAATMIQQLLDEDAANPQAIIAFAQLKLAIGEKDAAQQALESLPLDEQQKPEVAAMKAQMLFESVASTAPPIEELQQKLQQDASDSEARYQLAAQLVMQNQLEAALDELLLIVQKDRAYGDDAARKAMIQVFDIIGDHPITSTYRSRMFNYLY
ncbi:thioredoxin [Solemya velum gill symbiont]|uniref:Thioredoxin n=1 Tax=Solemya velum gill symbiont TaxID=2340 RepID=A0A1T2N1V8_SOVGS|nr:thioredoxin [Solemya velum gill symbiont]OOY34182.1 thioredoxin [Solemya velum gill symbiont]OOY36880.1 thioredoxin [Solemya velum gill symbiont]OOY40042.1 thioredoxin [Solemya velum gill symbiont]OOY43151.1 thioredoxin [Solemya velum gill symbiont]OOY44936.1 thioredoxin [Solemya velum gill symbiont]